MSFYAWVLVEVSFTHCTKNEVFYYGFLQSVWPSPQFPEDLITFTEEILNGKLHLLCSDWLQCFDSFWRLKEITPFNFLSKFWCGLSFVSTSCYYNSDINLIKAYFCYCSVCRFTMTCCWKRIYEELEKVKIWRVSVWKIVAKGHQTRSTRWNFQLSFFYWHKKLKKWMAKTVN